mmetsp:Transcript_10380/g.31956  ORF Transcript_10380/g.31956 Transcript_10380/m.31956 type:complete len:250 (+) Transcript_10380:153-902(+)
MNIGNDTTVGDDGSLGARVQQLVELVVVADGQHDVTRSDTTAFVVPSGVAGQLEHLGHHVLEHRSQVHGCTFSDTVALGQQADGVAHTWHRKHQTAHLAGDRGPTAATAFGDGLCALRNSVLCQLAGQLETNSSLDLTTADGELLRGLHESACLRDDAAQQHNDVVIGNAHRLLGEASVGMHLLQNLVDVGLVRKVRSLGSSTHTTLLLHHWFLCSKRKHDRELKWLSLNRKKIERDRGMCSSQEVHLF